MDKKLLVLFLLVTSWLSVCWATRGGFRICFKETERSSQCQGPSHTCSGWSYSPAWSQPFRDDTDNRGGGCHYQWRIEAQGTIDPKMEYRLCFRETEGSSQCQGIRNSCTGWTPCPSWTSRFRDDTDNRAGGCRYAWKLESRSPKPKKPIQFYPCPSLPSAATYPRKQFKSLQRQNCTIIFGIQLMDGRTRFIT